MITNFFCLFLDRLNPSRKLPTWFAWPLSQSQTRLIFCRCRSLDYEKHWWNHIWCRKRRIIPTSRTSGSWLALRLFPKENDHSTHWNLSTYLHPQYPGFESKSYYRSLPSFSKMSDSFHSSLAGVYSVPFRARHSGGCRAVGVTWLANSYRNIWRAIWIQKKKKKERSLPLVVLGLWRKSFKLKLVNWS